MAAEIGAMVATEQLDGLRMMSVDPLDFVVAPKAIAHDRSRCRCCRRSSPLFAIFGGYLVGVDVLGGDARHLHLDARGRGALLGRRRGRSLLKALVFGVLVGVDRHLSRFHRARRTSAGVSAATTSTVVTTSVCILLVDFVITAFWGV